jgi:hypothetical protein
MNVEPAIGFVIAAGDTPVVGPLYPDACRLKRHRRNHPSSVVTDGKVLGYYAMVSVTTEFAGLKVVGNAQLTVLHSIAQFPATLVGLSADQITSTIAGM